MIRASTHRHDEHFKACVTLRCQYTLNTWGKFPGTVGSVWVMNSLQAQHLDLAFYDRHFRLGVYLATHREHMKVWHRGRLHAPGPDRYMHRAFGGAHTRARARTS